MTKPLLLLSGVRKMFPPHRQYVQIEREDAGDPMLANLPQMQTAIPRFARTFNPFAKEDKPAENEDIPSALLPSPKLRAKIPLVNEPDPYD